MESEVLLPFPRGSTYSDAGTVTMDSTTAKELEGKIFKVRDTVHGTPLPVRLRVVRNGSGAAISFSTYANRFFRFGVAAEQMGRVILSQANDAGQTAKPLDDAYGASFSWPANDLGYVVDEGPCDVMNAVGASGGVNEHVATNSVGRATAAADTDTLIGYRDEAAVTDTVTRIVVYPGLHARYPGDNTMSSG